MNMQIDQTETNDPRMLDDAVENRGGEGSNGPTWSFDAGQNVDPTEYEEASPAEDSVRLYLSEMGAVPLLNKKGEVRLAKRMERGERRMKKGLARSAWLWNRLEEIRLRLNERPDHVRPLIEAGIESKDAVKLGRRIQQKLEMIRDMLAECDALAAKEPAAQAAQWRKRAWRWKLGQPCGISPRDFMSVMSNFAKKSLADIR